MAWILLIVAALAAAASVDAPSLGYKGASVAIMLGACAASVYLADGPRWGPVVAAAVGAGTGLIVSALIGGSSSGRGSSRG